MPTNNTYLGDALAIPGAAQLSMLGTVPILDDSAILDNPTPVRRSIVQCYLLIHTRAIRVMTDLRGHFSFPQELISLKPVPSCCP